MTCHQFCALCRKLASVHDCMHIGSVPAEIVGWGGGGGGRIHLQCDEHMAAYYA